jgi:hypothetical protein
VRSEGRALELDCWTRDKDEVACEVILARGMWVELRLVVNPSSTCRQDV